MQMNEDQFEFLMEFLRIPSPPGHEQEAARVWREWGASACDAVETDPLGNSYLHLNPTSEPRVLLAAHIDEIGLIVTHVDDGGFVFFDGMGRWDPEVLAGQRVQIVTKRGVLPGVVGRNDLFRRSDEEQTRRVRLSDYWVDIGVQTREKVLELVRIGDPIIIDAEPLVLGDELIVGRGLDDRIGCFVIAEVMRSISGAALPFAVTAVATVQEEVGYRGAQVSAYRMTPRLAIVVDVYSTSDTPASAKTKERLGEITLGHGPVIGRGPNISPELFDHFIDVAERNGIPYQLEAEPKPTFTDANVIQLSQSGVRTVLVSIPNRYSHSPVEVVHCQDVQNTVRLIAQAVQDLRSSELL